MRAIQKILIGLAVATGLANAADMAVVVRPDLPITNLTFADARKLFLGERQFWPKNIRVTLLIRAPVAPEREVVLRTIYQMSEAQFRQYWIAKVFRADVSAGPKIVYSTEMATELLFAIPGAVTFMEAGKTPKDLKTLKIDGRLPGEKGYSLR